LGVFPLTLGHPEKSFKLFKEILKGLTPFWNASEKLAYIRTINHLDRADVHNCLTGFFSQISELGQGSQRRRPGPYGNKKGKS
jgi:hypothetical protein